MSSSSTGGLRAVAALSVALALSACQYFPSHEDVYVPVPLRIGDMRIEGADTSYVLEGPGYELRAYAREVLLEARADLDGAAAAFRRHFGTEPQVVRIHYIPIEDRSFRSPQRRGDTLSQPTGRRGSGELRVNVVRPRDRGEPIRVPPVAGPLAREWVLAFERAATGVDPLTGVGAAGDTAARALPAWFRLGAAELVARSSRQTMYLALLRRQLDDAPTLESFFQAPSPEPVDPSVAPPRRRTQQQTSNVPRLDRIGLWRAQSIAVTRYMADREGPEFIGMVAERLLRGEDIFEITRSARSLAATPAALDEAWRVWVSTVAEPLRGE